MQQPKYYLEEACISLMIHHISAQNTVHYATMSLVVTPLSKRGGEFNAVTQH